MSFQTERLTRRRTDILSANTIVLCSQLLLWMLNDDSHAVSWLLWTAWRLL